MKRVGDGISMLLEYQLFELINSNLELKKTFTNESHITVDEIYILIIGIPFHPHLKVFCLLKHFSKKAAAYVAFRANKLR